MSPYQLLFSLCLCTVVSSSDVAAKLESDSEAAILKGNWEEAKKLVLKSHEKNLDISAIVRAAVQTVKRNGDELVRLLDKKHNAVLKVPPAFQWAQDEEAIYLLIKFAYRWSSPGSLQIEKEGVDVTAKTFLFSGQGTGSHLGKLYELELDLYGGVIPDATEWSIGSVGKLSVVLQKVKRGQWPRLTEATEKRPNMHIWWERREQLEKQMKENKKKEQEHNEAKYRETLKKHNKAEEELKELKGELNGHSAHNQCERNKEYKDKLDKKIEDDVAAKKYQKKREYFDDSDDEL